MSSYRPRRASFRRHCDDVEFPAYLLERLNYDVDSPMRHRIRTPTHPNGVIKDNSVRSMLAEQSDRWDPLRVPRSGDGRRRCPCDAHRSDGVLGCCRRDVRGCVGRVAAPVKARSRRRHRQPWLLHGLGRRRFAEPLRRAGVGVRTSPTAIEYGCAWMGGHWNFSEDDRRKWNELQNTPRDIQRLSSHLVSLYYDAPVVPAA